jgi:hypothetical protein
MTEPIGNRLRSLLGSDVYSVKGRLRSDDLLVRERVRHGLGEATARLRELAGEWRADRVPPSTREHPFPPAEVMEPIRRAERLGRAIDDLSTTVGGLPLMSQDRVWDRVRKVGLDELLQFDWTMIGEAEALALAITECGALDEVDIGAAEERIKVLRAVIADRRRYIEILA